MTLAVQVYVMSSMHTQPRRRVSISKLVSEYRVARYTSGLIATAPCLVSALEQGITTLFEAESIVLGEDREVSLPARVITDDHRV